MSKKLLLSAILALGLSSPLLAQQGQSFQRVSTFTVRQNAPSAKRTVAEILSADASGKLVVYTDAETNSLGLLDISDPSRPKAAGTIPVGGSPTSVVVHDGLALVAVARSHKAGHLKVVDLKTRKVVANFDLGGQPDCIGRSPDGRYAAIAIENENKTGASEPPPGWVTIVDLSGQPKQWKLRRVELEGLASTWPDDPEPEFLDINEQNIAAVTLQENNHIVLIDLVTGKLVDSFSAGTVDLKDVDLIKDRRIQTTGSRDDVPREPDAIAWSSLGLVTADEGDLMGGSRTFTLFSRRGEVLHSSGNQLDRLAAQIGHYPDFRSDDKGCEPEGVEVGVFAGQEYVFVGLERASLIAVYEVVKGGLRFKQVLASGVGPEGILALPQRNLLLVAAEVDKPKKGVHSAISIFKLQDGSPSYPNLRSDGLGWAGLSGLSADIYRPGLLYTVEDRQMRPSSILTIDANQTPARITSELYLKSSDGSRTNYDLEGVSVAAKGGFWAVSEGSKKKPNLLLRVDPRGGVVKEIGLPPELTTHKKKNGFEGVAEVEGKVYVAFQRPWKNQSKAEVHIACYEPEPERWSFATYPLVDRSTGVSGLTAWGDALAVLERDKGAGPEARIKRVYRVDLNSFGNGPLKKTLLFDLLPHLQASKGQIPEKIEGIARDRSGTLYVVNDNDGTSDTNGETTLLKLK